MVHLLVVHLLGSSRWNPFLVKEGTFLFSDGEEIGFVLVERISASRTLSKRMLLEGGGSNNGEALLWVARLAAY